MFDRKNDNDDDDDDDEDDYHEAKQKRRDKRRRKFDTPIPGGEGKLKDPSFHRGNVRKKNWRDYLDEDSED